MTGRTEYNKISYLRKKVEGMNVEEKLNEINKLEEKEKLAFYRALILSKFREWEGMNNL